MGKQVSKQASKQANGQASKQASKQMGKQASKQTNKQPSKQTNGQASKQASKPYRTLVLGEVEAREALAEGVVEVDGDEGWERPKGGLAAQQDLVGLVGVPFNGNWR